jgi:hypothetical protein
MSKMCLLCTLLLCSVGLVLEASDVLIVADEMPQMEVLVKVLKTGENITSTLVRQVDLPGQLSTYHAVIVFLHGALLESTEKQFIDYANSGGRLILIHHSINSLRRKNKYWLDFLGVSLPQGDRSQGGYWFANPVTFSVVNLAPRHYITTHKVEYDTRIPYTSSEPGGKEAEYPAFAIKDSEVYLNHAFTDGNQKTVLLGLKFEDPKSGTVYMQDRAGWYKKAGKGWIMYFQPGHAVKDMENSAYSQILVNAVSAKLTR